MSGVKIAKKTVPEPICVANVAGNVYERNDIKFVVLASRGKRVVVAPIIHDKLGQKREDVHIADATDLLEIGIVGGRWLVRVNDLFECRELAAAAKGTLPAHLLDQVQRAAETAARARVYDSRDFWHAEDLAWSEEWRDRLEECRCNLPAWWP